MVHGSTASLIAAALAAGTLCGCGANTIRLDRGGAVASAGSVAVNRTSAFFDAVRDARDEASIALVASDPSCAWGGSVVVRGPVTALPGARPALCRREGERADPAAGDIIVSLKPVDAAALRPTLVALDTLASYAEAVTQILTDDAPDPTAELADAAGKLAVIGVGLADTAGGAAAPTLSEEQKAAIDGLTGLIGQLAAEQRKVDALRQLAASQNARVQTIVRQLRHSVELWQRASLSGDLQSTEMALANAYNTSRAQPPLSGNFDARRAMLRQVVAAKRETRAAPAVAEAVSAALGEVEAAQTALVAAYTRNPNWTAAERAKAARINRARIAAAFRSLASLATLAL